MSENKLGDMTVKEAAELMGIRPTALRVRMQQGMYPEIGFAVLTDSPISPYSNKKKYRYALFGAAVKEYVRRRGRCV